MLTSRDEVIIARIGAAVEGRKRDVLSTDWRRGNRPHEWRRTVAFTAPFGVSCELVYRGDGRLPEREVAAQLIVTLDGRGWRALRWDWRPERPHTNRVGPPELRGLVMFGGVHAFVDNAPLGLSAFQSCNLPVCRPWSVTPPSFADLVQAVCVSLRVEGLMLEAPPWSPRLI